jgi:hypothetical protein
LEAISLMEAGLQDFSYSFEAGAGVKAAQEVYLSQNLLLTTYRETFR